MKTQDSSYQHGRTHIDNQGTLKQPLPVRIFHELLCKDALAFITKDFDKTEEE